MTKIKVRENEEKKKLIKRLKTIEGQIGGIAKMVESDRYCYDILIQVSAIKEALKSFSNEVLKQHLATCVTNDLKNNNLEIIDELMNLIRRLN